MSKVNILKIIEGVGACSENLIGISENLISISEKVSVISKVIVEIISEFQTETDKPAIETKAKKSAPKQIEAKAEPVKEAAKEYTFIEVRTILAEKSRAGHTADIKKILVSHGAEKLSEIEKTARAIVDNAQEQKHQMEMQMQKKRDAFDVDMEKETNEKILKIQSDLATNMEKLLKKQEEQNNNEIESLKQDFKEHHSEYAKQILERVIKV